MAYTNAGGEPRMPHSIPVMCLTAVLVTCAFSVFTGVGAAQRRTPVLDAAPGDTGRRITEDGLLANYFPARLKSAALLTLTGSVGGLTMSDTAIALQSEGFSVLNLSYFRGPGQNPNAELIPLEYFATALTWLRGRTRSGSRPSGDCRRIQRRRSCSGCR